MISQWIPDLPGFTMPDPKMLLAGLGILIVGLFVASLLSAIVFKISSRYFSAHHSMLFRKTSFYVIMIVFVFFSMDKVGFNLKTLAGVLGIGTVAIAWAANTAVSNVASGIFLLGERPFEIGDYVRINGVDGWDGQILSIDLLSVKMRTRDNTLVRMPNELLLKSELRNLTRFPIRRVDIKIRVAFNENLNQVKNILFNAAHINPLSLEFPVPELFFLEFGEAGVLLQFSVWSKQTSFIELQTSIQTEIQEQFRQQNIRLPMLYFDAHRNALAQT